MMETCGTECKGYVESELRELNDKWAALQATLLDKKNELKERIETMAYLGNELDNVFEKVKMLTTSTDDLRAVTLETVKVEEQRESYEVRDIEYKEGR